MNGRRGRYAAIAVALLLLVTVPIWVGNPYYINIASQILFWAIGALALNVIVGSLGLLSMIAMNRAGRHRIPLLAVNTCVHELLHGAFVEIQYRVAIRLLIACVDQRIERQGVLVRRRNRLFDEAADHAGFQGTEFCFHGLDDG